MFRQEQKKYKRIFFVTILISHLSCRLILEQLTNDLLVFLVSYISVDVRKYRP